MRVYHVLRTRKARYAREVYRAGELTLIRSTECELAIGVANSRGWLKREGHNVLRDDRLLEEAVNN